MRARVGTHGRTGLVARLSRAVFAAFLVAALTSTVAPPATAAAQQAAATQQASAGPPFEVVGTVPLFDGSTPPATHDLDGFLVINSGTRRGYQLFQRPGRTVVSSFDLDTRLHRRTIELPRMVLASVCGPMVRPPCTWIGTSNAPGDVLHAVDEQGGKLYLGGITTTAGDLTNTPILTVMEIDEALFDRGAPIDDDAGGAGTEDDKAGFLRHLRIPATQVAELTARDLYGIEFFRDGNAGKLLLLFSGTPRGAGSDPTPSRGAHDHYVAQWDATTGAGDWTLLLQACSRGLLVQGTSWQYQLPILRGKPHVVDGVTRQYLYVGCQAGDSIAAAVRVPLLPTGHPDPDLTLQQAFPLPRSHSNVLADPDGERLLFQTDVAGSAWWVFDGRSGAWVGSIGSTLFSGYTVAAGVDRRTGRLYTLVPDHIKGTTKVEAVPGGFGYTDTRLTPAPQTRYVLPDLDYPGQFRMQVDPAAPGRDRQIFLRRGSRVNGTTPQYPSTEVNKARPVESEIIVIRDREPVPETASFGDIDALTVDRPEEEGVTEVGYTGVARGFGTRVLLVGGATAAVSRQLDGNIFTKGTELAGVKVPATINACYRNDRELTFGTSEASSTDLATSAKSVALFADESTKTDLGQPGARCPAPGTQLIPDMPEEIETVPPVVSVEKKNQQFIAQMIDAQAGQEWDSNADKKDDYTSSCSGDQEPEPIEFRKPGQEYDAEVKCAQSEQTAEASSSAELTPSPDVPIRIADSSVETKVQRDPKEGVVSAVTSTVRGLEITGVGTIGLIRTTATSWANGRKGTKDKRGARTHFTRTFCAVDLPTLKFSGCRSGDDGPDDVVAALNRVFGRFGEARLRAPDSDYQRGTPGGYQAAIQRDRKQAFTDEFVSRDASNAVPGLELVLYANDSPDKGAGRQIFQFAGVEASSTYAIKCLTGKNAAGTDCRGAPGTDPSNLTLLLQDGFEKPLAGGVFKVHKDVNGDGALGVDDPVMANGTCMTDADGTGNCSWQGITPGDYVIEQTTAPAGYAAVEDFALNLPSGNNMDVTFTNLRAVAGVLLGLVDGESGDPLAGGEFELYQDDGDGTVSGADKLYATCKTDDVGLCEFELPAGSPAAAAAADPKLPCFGQAADGANESKLEDDLTGALEGQLDGVLAEPEATKEICVAEVPLGAYVVHQKTAPAEYDAAEDLPVQFELPGQVALLVFANGLAAIPGTAGSEAAPADPGEAPREIPPVENTVVDPGSATPQPIVQSSPIKGGGGPLQRAINRIVSAPASAIRWLFSNPRELGLMVAVWTVIWLPCYLAERRRVLRALRDPSTSSPAIGAITA